MGTATGMAPLGNVAYVDNDPVALGADAVTFVQAPFTGVISAVSYIPAAALTGANTNTRALSVTNRGQAGAGNTSIATQQYNTGVNLTAKAPNVIPLSGTPANLNVVAGDVLELASTHIGTGIADPGGTFVLTFARD